MDKFPVSHNVLEQLPVYNYVLLSFKKYARTSVSCKVIAEVENWPI